MNDKERARLAVIRGAIDGAYTVAKASVKLGVSKRWVKELKRRVRESGDGAVIHGNSGRNPANTTNTAIVRRIVSLKKSAMYEKANFAHFRELLEERENIKISYSCLRSALTKAGVVSPKTRRRQGQRHDMRPRKAKTGELVQTDATLFDWFGDKSMSALHGYQDDATGDILGLYLCKNECLQGYFEAFRQVLLNYGVPDGIYADRIGIYFVNTKHPENWSIEEQLAGKTLEKTQFGRIAEKLGCTLIPAGSPQAKGRIERLWETLQSRLVQCFIMNDIHDIKAANAALPRFIRDFNKRFHREAENKTESAFAPLAANYDLDTLLTAKYARKTDNAGCFSFHNYTFRVQSGKPLVKKNIVFLFSEKIGFKAYCDKTYYPVEFPEFLNKGIRSHLPKVTKRLLYDCFFADLKNPELLSANISAKDGDGGRGELIAS